MSSDDFDLYGDLDEALIEPLQEEVQKKQTEELEKQKNYEKFQEETEKVINELTTSNFQLKKNISLLLVTAKSEIERKDQQIKDLRREMDEIIFRKNKGSQKKAFDKSTQTDKVDSSDNNRSNSSRYNESNKFHDKYKSKETTDFDRHKRKLSPERRYSDDYRKTSHRDDKSRSKNYDEKNRKSSHESSQKRSRSPEKYDKKSTKQELREDDLRKTLSKNKNDSSNKDPPKKSESSSGRDKRDKYKQKDIIKEKSSCKKEKTDDERDRKKKVAKISPTKVNDSKTVPEHSLSVEIVKKELPNDTPITKDIATSPKILDSKAVPGHSPSMEIVKKELLIEHSKDIPLAEEIITSPKIVEKEVKEPKNNEIFVTIPEKYVSENESELHKIETAHELEKIEKSEVISNFLNLSAESDTNEVPDQNEIKVDEKIYNEEFKIEEAEILLKTEDPKIKKSKYVPIFEAKLFSDLNSMESNEIKLEKKALSPKKEEIFNSSQKFTSMDTITSKDPSLPITVTIEKPREEVESKDNPIEDLKAPITNVIQEIKEEPVNIPESKNDNNSTTVSPNDSFESTKENSLNNSIEKKKHKKRKITTEVEEDGTIVWTLTRKKRKIKDQS